MIKILAMLFVVTLFMCSCSANSNNGKPDNNLNFGRHQIYIRDDFNADGLTATFLNSNNDNTENVDLELINENEDYYTYTGYGDIDKYNMVYFTGSDGDESIHLAFNDFVSGYHISAYGVYPFTYDEEEEEIDYEIVSLPYEKKQKDIYIWTPDNYDKNSDEKYSVIYMTDGQNLFNTSATSFGSWGVAESAKSMTAQSGNKCIIVGIDDSTSSRDSELTPNIGEPAENHEDYENGKGKVYSDFVYETVVPYIEKNYNVYTDSKHNSICGSSMGGIESFYIGMEHPDKFGTIGAMSPAFLIFDKDTWIDYLSALKFDNNEPLVYIYNGNSDELEISLYECAKDMVDYLDEVNYPKNKVAVNFYEEGLHNERYWRAIFPEFLKYAFK